MATRARAFVFTINNYTQDDIQSVKKLKCQYIVYGYEVAPTTGTKHIQGYVYFRNPISFKSLCKKIKRARIEIAKGNASQNRTYCTKSGDYVEEGEMPKQGCRNDLQSVREFVQDSSHNPMRNLLMNTNVNYQAIRLAEKYLMYCEPVRTWEPEVRWYWGESGSGKTTGALAEFPDAFFKTGRNDWWCGYDAHEVIIIDEFRKDFCTYHDLLTLLGGAPYKFQIKGGSRQNLAKIIIITSCYHPETVYSTREDLYQLTRRISIVKEFRRI